MRPDTDRAGRRLSAGGRIRLSLLSRLALTITAVVVLATVAAGTGVRRFAHLVIVQGDMMTMDRLPAFLRETGFYLTGVTMVTAAVSVIAAWLLVRQIIRPLLRIEQMAARVAAGDYSRRLDERGADELARLAGAIDEMTAALAHVEQMRRDLVANVAHELRTPLTATQGLLFAMRDGLMPASQENLEQAAEELGRLTRLVEALQELSRSDATRRLERAPLDLQALAADVLAGMMPLFEERQVGVRREPGPPVAVLANRDALVQVLVNLLDNAAKYTPPGGWVRMHVTPEGEAAISNSGPGISAADLPRVFERFYRGEKSRSRVTGGAGIGLAIVKNLMEAMGGDVRAESGDGVTTFTIRLERSGGRA